MELQEIEIIRRALDTEVSHKEYVKNVTKAKNILNKYETLQASNDKSKLLLSDVVCGCCGKNPPEICGSCVSDIAQNTGDAAYNSR